MKKKDGLLLVKVLEGLDRTNLGHRRERLFSRLFFLTAVVHDATIGSLSFGLEPLSDITASWTYCSLLSNGVKSLLSNRLYQNSSGGGGVFGSSSSSRTT
jgi:hypothetical protein